MKFFNVAAFSNLAPDHHTQWTAPLRYDTSHVSSYWGPGTYLAWYLSAISVIGRRLLLADQRAGADASPSATRTPHISGEMLAAIAYPTVSLVVGIMASIKRDFATFAVSCQVTSAASFLGLLALASSQGLRFGTDSLLLGEVVLVLWCTIPGNLEMPNTAMLVIITSWAIAGKLGKAKWNPINSDRRIRAMAFLGSHALVTFLWPCSRFIPPTGASLTDLDQAAALSIELVVLLYQWQNGLVICAKELRKSLVVFINVCRGRQMQSLHPSWYSRSAVVRQRQQAAQEEEGSLNSHPNL